MREVVKEVRECQKCCLHIIRTKTVPGEGPLDADIMFIGEGPGGREDREGRPFVGRAGEVLEELFTAVGLSRDEVFITNIVKCRPPNNRAPKTDEVQACFPYLQRQIHIVQPKIIATLGRHATKALLGSQGIRGRKYKFEEFTVIPLYHPAAGLYNSTLKPVMIKDMRSLVEEIKKRRKIEQ